MAPTTESACRETTMRIERVDVIPLTGATVDGGWPQGHEPQENLHTLVEVRTDDGLTGVGQLLHLGHARRAARSSCSGRC